MKKLFITGFMMMSFLGFSQELDVNIQISTQESYEMGTGVLEANVTGGKAPYYILWSNGKTGSKITGVSKKNYIVRVSDSEGNVVEQLVIINPSNTNTTTK